VDAQTLRSYDAAGSCDPGTGACAYGHADQACEEQCAGGGCVELGDDFALVIPEGTRVCSDKRSTHDVFGEYRSRMRVAFREGVVRLPPDQAEFERDWIESIELGPGRERLQPLSEGVFSRTAAAERTEYRFRQAFSGPGGAYALEYAVRFNAAPGQARARVFDEVYLSPPVRYSADTLELRVDDAAGGAWFFFTCSHDLYLPVLHRIQTADGAELTLEERSLPSDACMLACPTGLRRASFRRGQERREVADPFRLAFVDGQHNWFDRFLVVFDEPVAGIHALHYFPQDRDAPEKRVEHLDGALTFLDASAVTSHLTVALGSTFDAGAGTATSCAAHCAQQGLYQGCEASCPLGGQALAGRCLPTDGWPPAGDWTALGSCEEDFAACVQAGRGYVQCCCVRIAEDW
jgi:hypothetical protein